VRGRLHLQGKNRESTKRIDHATARTKKVGRADAISLCPSKNSLKGRERLIQKEGLLRKPETPTFSAVGEAPKRKENRAPNRAPSPTPTGVRPQHPERGGTEGGQFRRLTRLHEQFLCSDKLPLRCKGVPWCFKSISRTWR
jgi:hypothetical protein